jgi:hypothetical protein
MQAGRIKTMPHKIRAGGQAGRTNFVPLKNTAGGQVPLNPTYYFTKPERNLM